MKRATKALGPLLIVMSASMLLACATEKTDNLTGSTNIRDTYVEGVPGGVQSIITTLDAHVSRIDLKQRKVTLRDAQGNQRTLTLSEKAVNLEQVVVGDRVLVEIAEEVAVFMREPGDQEQSADRTIELRAPAGEKPALLIANTQDVTAVITAVDVDQHHVTLQFADGVNKTITARPDLSLSQALVGRTMVIRITDALALTVTPK